MIEIKGLTIMQPWASLIATGRKRIETRSWATTYRGRVAIHAGKGFPDSFELMAALVGTRESLYGLPRGSIVAVARIDSVLTTREASRLIDDDERILGDYSAGRYGWMLTDVRALTDPVPCRGRLSLWSIAPEVLARIEEQLR